MSTRLRNDLRENVSAGWSVMEESERVMVAFTQRRVWGNESSDVSCEMTSVSCEWLASNFLMSCLSSILTWLTFYFQTCNIYSFPTLTFMCVSCTPQSPKEPCILLFRLSAFRIPVNLHL